MSNTYALYLDDCRYPPRTGDDWVLVRTVHAMRDLLEERGIPALASFDYELGLTDSAHDGGDAVMSFLDFLIVSGDKDAPVELEVRLHTSSGYGEAQMAQMLKEHAAACEAAGVRLVHMY
ncbi:MAG: cyclic-phosphate processing receiver domain-containing protein [Opitutaceae bacterium]